MGAPGLLLNDHPDLMMQIQVRVLIARNIMQFLTHLGRIMVGVHKKIGHTEQVALAVVGIKDILLPDFDMGNGNHRIVEGKYRIAASS